MGIFFATVGWFTDPCLLVSRLWFIELCPPPNRLVLVLVFAKDGCRLWCLLIGWDLATPKLIGVWSELCIDMCGTSFYCTEDAFIEYFWMLVGCFEGCLYCIAVFFADEAGLVERF